jgi:hypothetical protein
LLGITGKSKPGNGKSELPITATAGAIHNSAKAYESASSAHRQIRATDRLCA